MEDLSPWAIGFGSGGGGVAFMWWMLKDSVQTLKATVTAQGNEIRELRDKEIAKISARVAKIEDGCRAEVNAQAIDTMRPALARIESKVDETAKEISNIRGTMKSWEGWIGDVRKEERETGDRLIKHMTDNHAHGG